MNPDLGPWVVSGFLKDLLSWAGKVIKVDAGFLLRPATHRDRSTLVCPSLVKHTKYWSMKCDYSTFIYNVCGVCVYVFVCRGRCDSGSPQEEQDSVWAMASLSRWNPGRGKSSHTPGAVSAHRPISSFSCALLPSLCLVTALSWRRLSTSASRTTALLVTSWKRCSAWASSAQGCSTRTWRTWDWCQTYTARYTHLHTHSHKHTYWSTNCLNSLRFCRHAFRWLSATAQWKTAETLSAWKDLFQ